jgi:hypothetical protein
MEIFSRRKQRVEAGLGKGGSAGFFGWRRFFGRVSMKEFVLPRGLGARGFRLCLIEGEWALRIFIGGFLWRRGACRRALGLLLGFGLLL